MTINFYFKKADKGCEEQIRNHFTKEKQGRITRFLQHGNLDLADLKINVEYLSHHNNFSVEFILIIKKHKLVAEKTAFKLLEAFDTALDNLVFQLRKSEEILHDK
ncbi:MAG: HPF/RaiA family ribosome-associated protein [Candidatus Pacebacteria bacterium]|nr:HPF/RaiA family ribosome-associated protein [Candidatus Paceibacterota bacterium]